MPQMSALWTSALEGACSLKLPPKHNLQSGPIYLTNRLSTECSKEQGVTTKGPTQTYTVSKN